MAPTPSTGRTDGPSEDIGTGAASDKNRVLFWKGNTVVDATFSHVGPMSAGELRELAKKLPMPQGNKALPPPILANLPQTSLEKQTTHYAQGPAGYAGAGGVLPPELVGFDRGCGGGDGELLAVVGSGNADASSTIRRRRWPRRRRSRFATTSRRAAQRTAGVSEAAGGFRPGLARGAPQRADRGHCVSGDAIPDESHKLLEQVHYSGDLTPMPQPMESEVIEDRPLADGDRAAGDRGVQCGDSAGYFSGGWPGALSDCARQAGVVGVRGWSSSGCIWKS